MDRADHQPMIGSWLASVRPSFVNSWNFRVLISFLAYVKVQTNVAVVSQGSCFAMSVDKTTRFQRETAREWSKSFGLDQCTGKAST